LARRRESFAFETTLASRSFAPWLQGLRTEGYRVHLEFLSLPSTDMALARVRERVGLGGHEVPSAVVSRRYTRGLRNFISVYCSIADTWQLFDNSDRDEYRMIASGQSDAPARIVDEHGWNMLMELAR
jgi:predicted ABC-type ATPase